MVFIADTLPESGLVFPRVARNDAVYKRGTDRTTAVYPIKESCFESPMRNILMDATAQYNSVMVDKLTRKKDESLVGSTLEITPTVVEQLHQLAREGLCRTVFQPTGGIKGDAGLCGIRYDETHSGLLGERKEIISVRIWIDGPADAIYPFASIHKRSVVKALQMDMIKTVLSLQTGYMSTRTGLYHDHGAIEIGGKIHALYYPIDKRTEKIPLAKLDDPLWPKWLADCLGTQWA